MDKPWLAFYDDGVPETLEIPDVGLPTMLAQTAERYPDNVALIFYGRKMTYRQLDRQTSQFASALQGLGVQPGDRVTLLLPNTPQFVIGFYGALRAGARLVPTNPQYVERELAHQIEDSGTETVVTLSLFYDKVAAVRHQTGVKRVIVTNIKEYFPPVLRILFTLLKEKKEGHRVTISGQAETYWLQELLAQYRGTSPQPVPVNPDDAAVLTYTGGTTGVPKGAMLTHRNLVANMIQTASWLGGVSQGTEIIMGALPFFHCYGMTTVLNLAVECGGAMVLIPNPRDLKNVLGSINKHRPTLFPGVPTLYVAINNYPDIKKYDLSSIRSCISGSAPLPLEVQEEFERITGAELVEGYGLTEASPVTHANPLRGKRKAGTIGLPFPNTDAKIVDPDTREAMPQGEIGELAVRGPQVMKGYWNRPEETAAVLQDGWLYTGDIASVDDEGYFRIVDRKKDLIIASGFNVYPREVEEILYENPKVIEAAVVGVPDPYRGETVKAFVVLRAGEQATEEEIIEFCRTRLAPYKCPRSVDIRSSLPKSTIGKILRRVLAEEEITKISPEIEQNGPE
ncbi:MAG: long-chain fatty acid--CoA ligase [Chloroflexi bacterium]|nr:long-chain fatty acid--CoA ligase [Chloroflexota bacterium]